MYKIKKMIIIPLLIMSMTLGLSLNAFAGQGSMSYGGMTTIWTISSSVMNTTISSSNISVNLAAYGNVYQKKNDTIIAKFVSGEAYSTRYLSFSTYPKSGYKYIAHYLNSVDVYVSMSKVGSFKPTP